MRQIFLTLVRKIFPESFRIKIRDTAFGRGMFSFFSGEIASIHEKRLHGTEKKWQDSTQYPFYLPALEGLANDYTFIEERVKKNRCWPLYKGGECHCASI